MAKHKQPEPTPAVDDGWLKSAIGVVGELPKRHRPVAFIAVLIAGVGVSVAAMLVSKSGMDFLVGAPIIAFAVFVIFTLGLLSYLNPNSSTAMVGLFYFLPMLYSLLVVALAIIHRYDGSENQQKIEQDTNRKVTQLLAEITLITGGKIMVSNSPEKDGPAVTELVTALVEAVKQQKPAAQPAEASEQVTEVFGRVTEKAEPKYREQIDAVDKATGIVLMRTFTDKSGKYNLILRYNDPVIIVFLLFPASFCILCVCATLQPSQRHRRRFNRRCPQHPNGSGTPSTASATKMAPLKRFSPASSPS